MFVDCNENCARLYYAGERDEYDHDATNALRILEPILISRFRDALREAYKGEHIPIYPGEINMRSMDHEDYKVEVALRVFKTFADSVVDSSE